ncbi:MAG: SMC-Scp complex subunit ScpB [Clostridia bacterium]|nr:SMC-Scp complex subunit ScpB [Clostridia bacterium]
MGDTTVENENSPVIGNIEAAIEAILYAAGYPISYSKLSDVLGIGTKDVKKIVRLMADKYNSAESEHGISLLTFEDSCQFCTKEQFAPYIREALGIRRGGNLSASSMEVLAIVAYNQPVTRAFIDTVRGVDSAYAVGSLLDKNLIEACGRLDAPGRPMLYGTTENFLRVFGINSLSELPEVGELPVAKETVIIEGEQQVLDIPMPENSNAETSVEDTENE